MRTSKPISTISYNTENYLKMKLDELISSHKISDYMFIQHEPEADEAKKHFHVYMLPNTLLDTMDLQDYLKELDPKKPDKPLGCVDFHSSKIDDWILYVSHNPYYLASKGQSREFIYTKDDFRYNDKNTFDRNWIHAEKASDFAKEMNQLSIIKELTEGKISPYDVFLNNLVPLNKASWINNLFHLQGQFLDRNGGKTHTPVNETSG